jgi:hypothetical protein
LGHVAIDHWQDVLVGSIVGLVFSYFAYRQYYPTLESAYSHKPYSPRIPRDEYRESVLPFAPGAAQDDEEYAPNIIVHTSTGTPAYRRQGSGYSAVGRGGYTTGYPPPGHVRGQSGNGATLRPDPKYDEESAVGLAGPETVPRPSGEPLVELYGLDREREERAGGL